MPSVKCPACNHGFDIELTSHIPASQTFALKLECSGDMFGALTIAKAIESMAKLYVGVAKNMGEKVEVFIKHIHQEGKQAEIRFVVATVKARKHPSKD